MIFCKIKLLMRIIIIKINLKIIIKLNKNAKFIKLIVNNCKIKTKKLLIIIFFFFFLKYKIILFIKKKLLNLIQKFSY
jgi:hypothetical protein